jgi:hypothetical protein
LIGFACAVLVSQLAVSQAAGKLLAVLEFKGAEIKSDLLDASADAVRVGVIEGLAGRGVQVMTRANIMVLLKDMGKQDCTEGDCEVETARNIGADFVVSGSVVHIEDAFVATLKLHETKGGSLLATRQIVARLPTYLLAQLREHGRTLVADNVEPPPAAGPKEPEQVPHRADGGSIVGAFEYSSLGGSNGVARKGVYAAALHVFFASDSETPLAMEVDGALGGGSGLCYDFDFLLGPGHWFKQTVALAAVAGLGFDGITDGVMPFSFKAPVRLSLDLNLGAVVRIEAHAGVNWLFLTSNRRQSGSKAVGAFADELAAGGKIFIGRRGTMNSKGNPSALVLGFTYLEVLGTRTLLFMAGHASAFDPTFE